MFIGHFGVAFAAKKAMPKVSLGVLFLAGQFLDLLWPILVLLGIERVSVEPHATAFNSLNFEYYPFSHSLLGAIILSMFVRWGYYFATRDQRTSLWVGLVVLSHWFLDLIVHRPDLPLSLSDANKMGFGLWNWVAGTVMVELALFFGGYFMYKQVQKPATTKKRWGLIGLLAFLLTIFVLSVLAPQPPEGTPSAAIAGPALAMWILIPWAWWVDSKKTA